MLKTHTHELELVHIDEDFVPSKKADNDPNWSRRSREICDWSD